MAPCIQCPKAWPTAGGPCGLPKAMQGHSHLLHKHPHFFHVRHPDPVTRVSEGARGPDPPQGAPGCRARPSGQGLLGYSMARSTHISGPGPPSTPSESVAAPRDLAAGSSGGARVSHFPPLLSTEPNPGVGVGVGGRCGDLPQVCPAAGGSEHRCPHSLPHGGGSRRLQHSRAGQLPPKAQAAGEGTGSSPAGSLVPTCLQRQRPRPRACTALPGDGGGVDGGLPVRIRDGHSCAERARVPGGLAGPQLPLQTAPWVPSHDPGTPLRCPGESRVGRDHPPELDHLTLCPPLSAGPWAAVSAGAGTW